MGQFFFFRCSAERDNSKLPELQGAFKKLSCFFNSLGFFPAVTADCLKLYEVPRIERLIFFLKVHDTSVRLNETFSGSKNYPKIMQFPHWLDELYRIYSKTKQTSCKFSAFLSSCAFFSQVFQTLQCINNCS